MAIWPSSDDAPVPLKIYNAYQEILSLMWFISGFFLKHIIYINREINSLHVSWYGLMCETDLYKCIWSQNLFILWIIYSM